MLMKHIRDTKKIEEKERGPNPTSKTHTISEKKNVLRGIKIRKDNSEEKISKLQYIVIEMVSYQAEKEKGLKLRKMTEKWTEHQEAVGQL